MPSAPLPSPTEKALAEVARVAGLDRHAGLRKPSEAEAQLIAHGIDAGAYLRSDDAWVDFIAGGPLPVCFRTYVHAEDMRDPVIVAASERQEARQAEFCERMHSGDLAPLAYRVVAERAAAQVARAA